MRRNIRIALLVLIVSTAVPTWSQDLEPTPTPRLTPTTTLLTEVADTVQALGIFNFVAAGLLILGGIVIWRGLNPLLQSNANAQKAMIDSYQVLIQWQQDQNRHEDRLQETRQSQADALLQTAETQKATTRLVGEIETRDEAQSRTVQAVGSVNQFITKEFGAMNSKLDNMVSSITNVEKEFQNNKSIMNKLEVLVSDIAELKAMLSKLVSHVENVNPPKA